MLSGAGIGDLYSSHSTAVSRDLGNGHTENDLRPEFRRMGEPLGWFGTTADARSPAGAAATTDLKPVDCGKRGPYRP